MDGYTELAKMLKDRDNPKPLGVITGVVIKEPPDIEIRINENIVMKKHKLIFSSRLVAGHEQDFNIAGNIHFSDTNAGTTTSSSGHTHGIATLNVNTSYESKGTITRTNNLKNGDEVIMIPTSDGQYYYVLDKAVRL